MSTLTRFHNFMPKLTTKHYNTGTKQFILSNTVTPLCHYYTS